MSKAGTDAYGALRGMTLYLRTSYASGWWEYCSDREPLPSYSDIRSLYIDIDQLAQPPPKTLSVSFDSQAFGSVLAPKLLGNWIPVYFDSEHLTSSYCIYKSERARLDGQGIMNGAYINRGLLPDPPPGRLWMLLEEG